MSELRIAYLLKKFPRLSETFVLNEILHQERIGTRVHVWSRRSPDNEPRHPQFAELRAQVEQVNATNGMDPWLELFGPRPEHHALLERFGGIVRELSAFEHTRMPSLFAEALFLLPRARALGIQHIHAHFATDSAIVAMLIHELGGPTYSVTAHAKDIYRSAVNPKLLARIVTHSAFTVTVCDANVEFMKTQLPASAMARVRRLYNGIDLKSFKPRPSPRDENHVLIVARLVEKKGFGVLVSALSILRDREVPFQATFVGEGEERARIEALIAAAGLKDRIRMTGAQDQEQVRGWMSRASVMCLPCVVGEDGNRDALPTTLIEAQAMGLPCISTPVTGIPEILEHGRAGVLVPENDARATADAIQALFGDAARCSELARAGRSQVERLFDAEKSARTLRTWFEETALPVGAA